MRLDHLYGLLFKLYATPIACLVFLVGLLVLVIGLVCEKRAIWITGLILQILSGAFLLVLIWFV